MEAVAAAMKANLNVAMATTEAAAAIEAKLNTLIAATEVP